MSSEKLKPALSHRFCVAPMMNHTDRHFRYLLRLISRRARLYTEMVTTGALLHGDAERYLTFHPHEHPLAMQLGGSDPDELSRCAQMAERAGFDEVNLNVGCPSDRVKAGAFGACLMAEPQRVAACIAAMQDAVAIPVTVKSRIGIDDRDSYQHLADFIGTVGASGCKTFIIHARKAWLKGLSPRQNREVPPLRYEVVHQIKNDFPDLEIVINGGITSLEQAQAQYRYVDGVMIGRAICTNPYLLAEVDGKIYQATANVPNRYEILRQFMDYAADELAHGSAISRLGRNILGLFQGQTGARAYRRFLSEQIYKPHAGIEVFEKAMELVTV